jgi:hypothetical protein
VYSSCPEITIWRFSCYDDRLIEKISLAFIFWYDLMANSSKAAGKPSDQLESCDRAGANPPGAGPMEV